MYCTYCGSQNAKENVFCESCGRRLVAQFAPAAQPTAWKPSPPYRLTEAFLQGVQIQWFFVLEWVLANSFALCLWALLLLLGGWALGQALYTWIGGEPGMLNFSTEFALKLLMGQTSLESMYAWLIAAALLAVILTIALYGAIIGTFQWLVIRSHLGNSPWISRTVMAAFLAALAGGLLLTLSSNMEPGWGLALTGFGAGLGMGFVQWRILRPRMDNAWLWLAANTLAPMLALPLGYRVSQLNEWAGLILSVLVMNLLTGVALAWLLRQPVGQPHRVPA